MNNKFHLIKNRPSFILFYHLGLGGIQRKIVDMISYAEKKIPQNKFSKLHLVHRTTDSFNMNSQLPKKFKRIHIENILPKHPGRTRDYLFFLIYLIFEYNPRVLFPFLHQAGMACIIMKYLFFWKKIKVVISQDNILSLENQQKYSVKTHPNWMIGLAYRHADVIITQTQFSKNDLIENYGVKAKKIIVIHNWLKDNKLITKKKKYDLIYCGRFSPQKNLVKLLKIIKSVKKEIPSVKLCLVGDGVEKTKIVRYIKKHKLQKNVKIIPTRKGVIDLLARSRILTLTSDFEGQPMIIFEAMAQKVVPIVINYPGVKEYLHHESDGFIESSTKKMAKRIINLLQNKKLQRKVGAKARKTILRDHNEELIKKTLLHLL